MIYFVQAGDRVKIGFSASDRSTRRRLEAIASASAVDIKTLGVLDGTLEDERAWHKRFDKERHHGEWFNATPRLLDAIGKAARPLPDGSKGARLSFRCPISLVEAVDRARRGPVSTKAREAWLRDAVEIVLRQAEAVEAMARDESGEYQRRAVEQALGQRGAAASGARGPSVHSPAPAEQPDRDSVELDAWGASHDVEVVRPPREFRPYPKAADRKKKR